MKKKIGRKKKTEMLMQSPILFIYFLGKQISSFKAIEL